MADVEVLTDGSSTTIWNFSGTSTAGRAGLFATDAPSLPGNTDVTFLDIGDFTDSEDLVSSFGTTLSGAAQLTIQRASTGATDVFNITGLHIDDDGPGGFDDFSFSIAAVDPDDGAPSFEAGDMISWSGQLTVTGIMDVRDPFSIFQPFFGSTSNFGGIDGTLDLELRTSASEVPVPGAALLFLTTTGGGLVFRGRKKS
ncbi:MAG: hypothetical protein AAF830_08675 [Pseudomonadota bacterium]